MTTAAAGAQERLRSAAVVMLPAMAGVSTVRAHPAETAAPVAMAAALLVAKFADVDTDTVGLIAIVLSFVPAAVTWTVELIRGRAGE